MTDALRAMVGYALQTWKLNRSRRLGLEASGAISKSACAEGGPTSAKRHKEDDWCQPLHARTEHATER